MAAAVWGGGFRQGTLGGVWRCRGVTCCAVLGPQEEREFSQALLETKALLEEQLEAARARGSRLNQLEKDKLLLQSSLRQAQEVRGETGSRQKHRRRFPLCCCLVRPSPPASRLCACNELLLLPQAPLAVYSKAVETWAGPFVRPAETVASGAGIAGRPLASLLCGSPPKRTRGKEEEGRAGRSRRLSLFSSPLRRWGLRERKMAATASRFVAAPRWNPPSFRRNGSSSSTRPRSSCGRTWGWRDGCGKAWGSPSMCSGQKSWSSIGRSTVSLKDLHLCRAWADQRRLWGHGRALGWHAGSTPALALGRAGKDPSDSCCC